jgi:rsbT co-antagonist protein RsbR
MLQVESTKLASVLQDNQAELLKNWIAQQRAVAGRESEANLQKMCTEFLQLFVQATAQGKLDEITGPTWAPIRSFLSDLSARRARESYTSSETALFILSLKQVLFKRLSDELSKRPEELIKEIWASGLILDKLALYTVEVYQKTREEIIDNQKKDLLELSTPVIHIWKGVVALPIIGALDSARSQIMMERLLEVLAASGASIAILDISGVPAIDTLVAQHLLKTIQAAKIMGANCIISGIRPETAQTIVHLGIDLSNIRTKSTMARALEDAFSILRMKVIESTEKAPAVL